ncbi:MAG: M1 family metallopeptidase, partial [Bacteroidota bacterium]
LLKKGGQRDWPFNPDLIGNGVTLHRIKVNGTTIDTADIRNSSSRYGLYGRGPIRYGTNLILPLRPVLRGDDSVEVEIEWSYIFPDSYRLRMGKYGPSTYFISYWYPQVAVFDDVHGWDLLDYTGSQEMYNDFSDFKVRITVPDTVMVWATGELTNAKKLLQKPVFKRWQHAHKTDTVVQIVGAEDLAADKVLRKDASTWEFNAKQVPDFAFGISDFFHWDASSIEVEPGRRVLAQAAYNPNNFMYDSCVAISRRVLDELGNTLPGVPYPFPVMTVFNGSGGMEYPMIVNDGPVRDRADMIDLTYHEIAHTYFPFLMGTNERRYSWMDEGWANLFPARMVFREEPSAGDPYERYALSVASQAGRESYVPLMTPSSFLEGWVLSQHTYDRPMLAYGYLQDMLGDSLFRVCLKKYIADWQYKHPQPYDFFYSFSATSGQDLDWYWRAWFYEVHEPDLGLALVEQEGTTVTLTVESVGTLPVPVHLKFRLADGSNVERHASPVVWANGQRTWQFSEDFGQAVKSIRLGGSNIADNDLRNNRWTAK